MKSQNDNCCTVPNLTPSQIKQHSSLMQCIQNYGYTLCLRWLTAAAARHTRNLAAKSTQSPQQLTSRRRAQKILRSLSPTDLEALKSLCLSRLAP